LALRKYESEKKLPSFYIFGYLWQLRIESGKFFVKLFLNFRIFLAKKLKKNTRFSQFEKKNQHLIKIRPQKNPGFTVLTTMCFQFSMLNGFRVVVDVEGPFN
jgi:hypothetical protein